jgi:hypothetical protein
MGCSKVAATNPGLTSHEGAGSVLHASTPAFASCVRGPSPKATHICGQASLGRISCVPYVAAVREDNERRSRRVRREQVIGSLNSVSAGDQHAAERAQEALPPSPASRHRYPLCSATSPYLTYHSSPLLDADAPCLIYQMPRHSFVQVPPLRTVPSPLCAALSARHPSGDRHRFLHPPAIPNRHLHVPVQMCTWPAWPALRMAA